MLGISWNDRERNTEVRDRLNKVTEIVMTTEKRKLKFSQHMMWNENYFHMGGGMNAEEGNFTAENLRLARKEQNLAFSNGKLKFKKQK